MAATILKMIPFIILLLAILMFGHYFLYRMVVVCFSVSAVWAKTAIFSALMFLGASFLASSFLTRIKGGLFTQIFYIFGASWLAIFIHLLLAALFIWLGLKIFPLVNLSVLPAVWAGVVFGAAILFSLYGFLNAFAPRVNNLEVEIKNLPANWQGKTIVQISDVHLGHVHGKKFLEKIVALANSQNPDLVLITGDLFDGMDGDLNVFVEPLNNLRASSGVFFVVGNHETYLGHEGFMAVISQTNITPLNNRAVAIDGLQLAGLNYPSPQDPDSFIGQLRRNARLADLVADFQVGLPTIFMYHAPTAIAHAKEAGVNLQLSGHTHAGQFFPFNLTTRSVYKKYNQGLHRDGNYAIYTTPGAGTWGPPIRTFNRPEVAAIKLK